VPTPSVNLQAGSSAPVVPTPAPVVAQAETFTISTDLVKATISAQGGDIVRLELLRYKEHDHKDKTFVLFDAKHQYLAQSGLIGEGLPTHRTTFKRVAGPTELAEGGNELKVRLEATTANGIKVAKTLTFKRGSYLIDVAWEVVNGRQKPVATHAYYQLQRDDVAPEGESAMVSTFTGPAVFTDAEKYQKIDFADITKEKAKFAKTADNGWLAMVQHYFVAAWVPKRKILA
jgi:YidC/Oxa1 family membrane protein insertase